MSETSEQIERAAGGQSPQWGHQLETKLVNGYPLQVLTPRPGRLASVLVQAERWRDREFLVCGQRRIGFSQFIDDCRSLARRLTELGVEAGRPALLLGANSPEWLAGFWGLTEVGAVVALGNAWWSAGEIADAVRLLDPSVIIADRKRGTVIEGEPSLATTPCLSLEDFATDLEPPVSAPPFRSIGGDEEEPAILIFTSGTTGRPKAAVLTHRAAVMGLQMLYAARGVMPDEFPVDGHQVTLLCGNPLFHVGAYLLQAQALLSGFRLVLLEGRFDPAQVLSLIERERINVWHAVPTLLSRVLGHPELRSRDLSSLFSFGASGSMVDPALISAAREAFPSARAGGGTSYGMTESGGAVTLIDGEDYLKHPTSVGRPVPGAELRIEQPDESGVGEILIRCPSAMSGYWGEVDGGVLDAEGWLHSGDLGRVDADGYFYVTGRVKDIIIRGGENVSASVVEQSLALHPDVLEAAVLGLEHSDLGEEVAAAVVVKAGSTLTGAELAAFLSSRISYFQVPSRWSLRTETLPVNASGKVLKPVLRREWRDRPATDCD